MEKVLAEAAGYAVFPSVGKAAMGIGGAHGKGVLYEAGKRIITAYYGTEPSKSYYQGCSTGGRQGLMEAQRFPGDYDGIVAGAPANNWTRLMAGDLDGTLAVFKDSASNLPASVVRLARAGQARLQAAPKRPYEQEKSA